ncbi:MAG: hypothetical protein ABH891_02755 [Candidatus Omnitrophota bacterium]
MLKKTVLIALLVAAILVPSALAFRVGDSKWGDTRDQVTERLTRLGWNILPSSFPQMIEAEAFLAGDPCRVQFMFNKNLRLSKIRTTWDTTQVGAGLKKELTKEYGAPHHAGDYTRHYEWYGSFRGEEIVLDFFDRGTRLTFDGGNDYR